MITPAQENARMLAAILGSDEDDASERLTGRFWSPLLPAARTPPGRRKWRPCSRGPSAW